MSVKGMTPAGLFWYVVGCIGFGAAYFAKVPAKKAMSDFGLCHMTGAEVFWYYLGCVLLGGSYFAKLPVAKALSELPQFKQELAAPLEQLPVPPPVEVAQLEQ